MELDRQIKILEMVKKRVNNSLGICDTLSYFCNNKITENEYYFMLDLLAKNKPNDVNQYKEFKNNSYWSNLNVPMGSAYWWFPLCHNTFLIRINYLNALINNIK